MGADLPLTFQAHPDQRQISVAVRHILRRRVAVLRVIAGLMVVWGAVFGLFLGLGVSYFLYFTVLALVVAVGFPELAVWRSLRSSTRLVVRPTSYHFDQDGYGVSTDLAQSRMRWAAVTAVDHLPGQMLLRLSKLQFISVPTSGLTTDQITELRALVRDHVTAPVQPLTAPSGTPGHPPAAVPGHPLSAPSAVPGQPLSARSAAPGHPLSAPSAVPGQPLSAPSAVPGQPLSAPSAVPGHPLSASSGAADTPADASAGVAPRGIRPSTP
ncbi:MAG: YcxB family protein [Actinoplanes sp.]